MENFTKDGNKQKVTIYDSGAFGVVGIKAKLVEYGFKSYAQYNSVPFVKYILKGKRKLQGFVKTTNPFILIVEGWENEDITNHNFNYDVTKKDECTIKASKYACFDVRYTTEFNERFETTEMNIVFDARYNVETSLNSEVKSDDTKEDIYEVYASFDSKYKGKSKSRADEFYNRFKIISSMGGSNYSGKEITMTKNSEIINTYK